MHEVPSLLFSLSYETRRAFFYSQIETRWVFFLREKKRNEKKRGEKNITGPTLKRKWNGLARNSTTASSSLKPERPSKNTQTREKGILRKVKKEMQSLSSLRSALCSIPTSFPLPSHGTFNSISRHAASPGKLNLY